MSDRLFRLLPGVIRAHDAERGHPLRDLLRVLGDEVDTVDEDIRRMYADLFIETCEPWVVPYLGDLVGYRWLPVPAGRHDCADEPEPYGLVPRRAVADAVRNRRRKGTRAVLEDVVGAVSAWPATVCDGPDGRRCAAAPADQVTVRVWRLPSWQLTRVRPHLLPRRTNTFALSVLSNDLQLYRRATTAQDAPVPAEPPLPEPLTVASLQDPDLLRAAYGEGRSLCLYEDGKPIAVERLRVQSLSGWQPEVFGDQVALDPERGRVMFPERYRTGRVRASYHYGFPMAYGGGEYSRPDRGVPLVSSLFAEGHLRDAAGFREVLATHADPFTVFLRAALDPAVLAGPGQEEDLRAELNRVLQAADLSAAELRFDDLDPEARQLLLTLGAGDTGVPPGPGRLRLNRLILEAHYPNHVRRSFARVRVTAQDGRRVLMTAVREAQDEPRPPLHLVVELADSGLYVEPVVLTLPPHHTLEIRAADGCRPTIVLPEQRADIDDMTITCGAGSRVVLDGLMVSDHAVRVIGHPAQVVVRHCTLVPGWRLDPDCEPCCGEEPSLVLTDVPLGGGAPLKAPAQDPTGPSGPVATCVEVAWSIVGTIVVQRDEVSAEPLSLHVRSSVVDATTPDGVAITAPNERRAHAMATVTESTVVGRTLVHAIALGENSIFTSTVEVARRQIGCLRYCYVTTDSRTPRRYACQPDLAMQAAGEGPGEAEDQRVRPSFRTTRYGLPDYCRLDDACPEEIRQGADDASALGVYHDLHEPRREANLREALTEYLPLGWALDVGFRS